MKRTYTRPDGTIWQRIRKSIVYKGKETYIEVYKGKHLENCKMADAAPYDIYEAGTGKTFINSPYQLSPHKID